MPKRPCVSVCRGYSSNTTVMYTPPDEIRGKKRKLREQDQASLECSTFDMSRRLNAEQYGVVVNAWGHSAGALHSLHGYRLLCKAHTDVRSIVKLRVTAVQHVGFFQILSLHWDTTISILRSTLSWLVVVLSGLISIDETFCRCGQPVLVRGHLLIGGCECEGYSRNFLSDAHFLEPETLHEL